MLLFRPWRCPHAALSSWIGPPVNFHGVVASDIWQTVYDHYLAWARELNYAFDPTNSWTSLTDWLPRALEALEPERRPALKQAGLLKRDDRKKESKKYGLHKARKAPQYSNR